MNLRFSSDQTKTNPARIGRRREGVKSGLMEELANKLRISTIYQKHYYFSSILVKFKFYPGFMRIYHKCIFYMPILINFSAYTCGSIIFATLLPNLTI